MLGCGAASVDDRAMTIGEHVLARAGVFSVSMGKDIRSVNGHSQLAS